MELALRQRVADTLRTQKRSALDAFADAINKRTGDRMPCWGDIADVVAATIPATSDPLPRAAPFSQAPGPVLRVPSRR